jgi:hypothetical protein
MRRIIRALNSTGILPVCFVPAAMTALLLMSPARLSADMISYDASTGDLPANPPFRYVDTSSLFGSTPVTPTISDGVASLGLTNDQPESFWYTDQMTLPNGSGFIVSATLKLDSESSSDPDQAGLAIALTDDQSLYQNLYIDPTGVFFSKLNSSDTGTVPDTSYSMDTTTWNTYTIQVQGNDVNLSVNGSPEISSTLFNLSATGQFVLPDYAAIGDISPFAQSQFDFTTFSVVVPEPSYGGATAIGMAIVIGMQMRRRAA